MIIAKPDAFVKIRNMNKRGFSLIELLVVIAIIGILATVSVTAYIGATKKAARSEAYSNLGSIRLLEEQFFAENACYGPLAAGVCPAAATTFTFMPATQAFVPAFLPGFRPGAGLSFTYSITVASGVGLPAAVPVPYAGSTAALVPATTPCFIATATALPNTRVVGDVFAIDCNNNRNFQ